MTTMMKRTGAAFAAAAASAALVLTSAGSAGADPGDPVTGGMTTFDVPTSYVSSAMAQGIRFTVGSPTTVTYDSTNNTFDTVFQVSGGDGSVNADYGSVVHAGSIHVKNPKQNKYVTLKKLTFHLDTLQLTAVPTTGSRTPVVLADVGGSHTFSSDPTTGRQEFTGDDVMINADGAAYLDATLNTSYFVAGQHVGTFDTVFYNSQY